jgi:hypothetical protein
MQAHLKPLYDRLAFRSPNGFPFGQDLKGCGALSHFVTGAATFAAYIRSGAQ